jgi:hypothetical protein
MAGEGGGANSLAPPVASENLTMELLTVMVFIID